MKRYILSTAAALDLEAIWEYIAQDSVEVADRWIGKLFDSFEAIARMPGIGHRREDLTSCAILFWPLESYLILYRAERDPIEIVAVIQGARDIPAFLRHRML